MSPNLLESALAAGTELWGAVSPESTATALDHLSIAATDVPTSAVILDAALGALGFVRIVELVDEEEDDAPVEAIGYGPPASRPQVWLVASDTPTTGVHIALRCATRAQVSEFFAAGVAAGARRRQTPRPWELFRAGYFGASVFDRAGNILEAYTDEQTRT